MSEQAPLYNDEEYSQLLRRGDNDEIMAYWGRVYEDERVRAAAQVERALARRRAEREANRAAIVEHQEVAIIPPQEKTVNGVRRMMRRLVEFVRL